MTVPPAEGCDRPGESVEQFVACVNARYGTRFPTVGDLPAGSPFVALYGYAIDRFVEREGYVYWGQVDRRWTLSLPPAPVSVDSVVVYLTLGEPQPKRGVT